MGSRFILINNFRRSLHHKGLWLIAFLAPIIISFGVNLINQFANTTYRIGVFYSMEGNVIKDHSAKYQVLEEQVTDLLVRLNQIEGVAAVIAREDSIHTDVIMGTYHYGIGVDKIAQVDMSEEQLMDALLSYDNQEKKEEFAKFLSQNLKNYNLKVDSESNIETVNQTDQGKSSSLTVMERLVACIISMFMIMSVIHAGMYIKDRKEGMVTRYCFAPKYRCSYMIGNYLYVFLITFMQVAISFAVICILQQYRITMTAYLTMVGMLSIVASSFAIIISTLCRNDVQASISASAITAIMSLLSGLFVSFSQLPGILQLTSVMNPIRWCIEFSKTIL